MTTIATLFSGGEGVGVGARMAGLEHLWGIEYDAAIADVARANGFHAITADVTQMNWSTLPAPDILHASPPCPNFSVAKTQRGETAQDRAVAQAVCDAITTLMPRVFTLENVRGYAGGYWPDSTPEEIEDRPKSLGMILDALTQCGYEYDLMIINSANYGVPQTRDRLYVIAMHGNLPPCLMPTHSKHGDMFTQRWIGWYEAIADIIDTLPPSQFAPWQLARLPEELRAMLEDTSTTPITNEERAEGAMTAEEREEWEELSVTPQMAGRARAFLVDSANTSRDATRLDADDPAMTVQAWHGRRPSHAPTAAVHGRVVAMTPRALARFQSFPDDYILPEKKSLACRVIGNAVPPRLYAAIIGAVLEQI